MSSSAPILAPSTPPRVGVALIACRKSDGNMLIGKRKGSHGAGTYAPPGGHLEHGETFAMCALRELYEETGIVPTAPFQLSYVSNDVMPSDEKHYVTIFMRVEVTDKEAEALKVKEPEKCEMWQWISFDALMRCYIQELIAKPEVPLFLPLKHYLESRTGENKPKDAFV